MGILNETVISTTEAAKLARVASGTINVWVRKGYEGIKLEAFFAGNTLKTSREALERFLTTITSRKLGT